MVSPERRARRLGPLLTASLALHLSLLILLLVTIQHRPRMAEQTPPADFAMVFEGHSPQLNSAPNPTLPKTPQPGSPAPSAATPAVPPAPAAPPTVAMLPPPPPPPPPSEQAHPTPAPPVSAETSPPLPLPAPVPPPTPAPAPLAMAIPRPPPIPAAPSPPQAPPRASPATPSKAPARPERQPERAPAFPTPMAFSLGLPHGITGGKAPDSATPNATPLRPPARIARPGAPGTIDLSFGPIEGGSLSSSASTQMEGVTVSNDWLNEVAAWWERHGYYPPQAGINGEDGDVTLHMRVDHDGRVEALELVSKSGSQWLDLAALSVFRDATLPPLPPDMPDKQIPFQVMIHYVLIRGSSRRHG